MHDPGDLIDRNYRVNRRLAMGGAGVTYLVRAVGEDEEEHGPQIALKLLFDRRDGGAYLRRLSTEAQILQELHHPNIVEYLGFVHRTGRSPYLLTRFEEGGSLLDHMKRVGTMGVRETAAVGRQVCMALEKGHAQGITHRDLKPENLLLRQVTSKGQVPEVRVADFGIAKVTGSIGAGLTRMGAFVGTPQYASPEQFIGEPASDKSDVYSLGAVMVFMMTARPMVPDAHTLASEDVYAKLMEVLPPGISRKSDPPEECEQISQILAYAMRMEPENRCTVSELLVMLNQFLESSDTGYAFLDRDESVDLTSEQYEEMATVHGDSDHPVIAPTTSLTRKDREEGSELKFADSNETSNAMEAPAPIDAVETHRGGTETTKMSSGVPNESVGHDASKHDTMGRSFYGLKRSTFGWGLAVVLGVYIGVPSALDGLPFRGGWPADSASDPSAVKWGRRAVKNAVKLHRQSIRRACKASGGEGFEIEAVINASGTVRWARPAEKLDVQAWCVAFTLSGSESGYTTLQKPSKVKLTVWP